MSAAGALLGHGGAGSSHRDFPGAPLPDTWFVAALANSKALSDLEPRLSDIYVQFSSVLPADGCPIQFSFYYGLDGNPPPSNLALLHRQFLTTALHEIGHGLGFAAYMDALSGEKHLGFDGAYDRFLENHATGKHTPEMTDQERADAAVAGPNLHWTGQKAVACGNDILTSGSDSETGHIEMHAPLELSPGSSVSHFSNELFPNQIMEAFGGLRPNVPSVDLCVLADLGWTMAEDAPPEPTTPPGTPSPPETPPGDPPTPPEPPPPSGPPPPGGPPIPEPEPPIPGPVPTAPVSPPVLPSPVLPTGQRVEAFCHGLRATIVGTEGSETLTGTPGRDVIHGLGGNDVIRGGAGNDVICGGSGRDKLFGGSGRDRMNGGPGRDRCVGGPGVDRIRC